MEYYFPVHTEDPNCTLTVVPAGALVTAEWDRAFRSALCGNTTTVLLDGYAYLFVLDREHIPAPPGFGSLPWRALPAEGLVEKRIIIDTDAWVLAATQAKLGKGRVEALEQILGSLIFTEPTVAADLDGETYIRPTPGVGQPSLTMQALQKAKTNRGL